MNQHAHLAPLAAKLSQIAGISCELLWQGDRKYTLFVEDANACAQLDKVAAYMKEGSPDQFICTERAEYDLECDMTCLYFSIAA